jgi:hypothetical protein
MDMKIFEEWMKIDFQKCYLIANKRQRGTGRSKTGWKFFFQLKTGKTRGPIPLSRRRGRRGRRGRRRHRTNNVT